MPEESPRTRSRRYITRYMPVITGPADLAGVAGLLEVEGGEFCACEELSPEMVAAVCRRGFLPMGLSLGELPFLLVKLHFYRMVLPFERLHVPRNAVRYGRGLVLYRNRNFVGTVKLIVATHGNDWLIPELVATLTSLHRSPVAGVELWSMELYDGTSCIAGEIGYRVGAVYTSLSGFHLRSGAGTAQMVALAELLRREGFAFWDLGMDVPYKRMLGAMELPREHFLERYAAASAASAQGCGRPGQWPSGPFDAEELIRAARDRERRRDIGEELHD